MGALSSSRDMLMRPRACRTLRGSSAYTMSERSEGNPLVTRPLLDFTEVAFKRGALKPEPVLEGPAATPGKLSVHEHDPCKWYELSIHVARQATPPSAQNSTLLNALNKSQFHQLSLSCLEAHVLLRRMVQGGWRLHARKERQ